MTAVTRIDVTDLSIALPEPIRIGGFLVNAREYVLVEITTADGLVGRSYALSRGAPVSACLTEFIAPMVIGKDSRQIARVWHELFEATIAPGRTGLVARATSLIDIALWDVKAQRARAPLWELLGGSRTEVPVLIVAGYAFPSTSREAVLRKVVAAADRGYSLIKFARSAKTTEFRELLDEADRQLPPQTGFVVDAAWAWRAVRQAVEEVILWPAGRLRWVEDPFPPEQYETYGEWRDYLGVPVGAGDELTDIELLGRYIRNSKLDVIRIDPTTMGGISVVKSICSTTHVPVSTHMYPEVAIHLAMGLQEYTYVETFDDRSDSVNPIEPSRLFIQGGPTYANGSAKAPARPGLGFEFDWDAAEQYTVRKQG